MLVARRFVLSGRVQGVGFRWFAEQAARLEGVGGWVMNRPDGAVEIFAEGDREALGRFESKVRRGPSSARVDHIEVLDDVPSGRAGGFRIKE